jgi:ribosome maturation factor RimP
LAEGKRPDTRMIAQRVIELLEADLATGGYDLLDVRVFQGGGRYQIRVFVDLLGDSLDSENQASESEGSENQDSENQDSENQASDDPRKGVSMDQVTKAARTASMLLEEADLFADQYVIEVSSPGIRRPLRKLEHYRRVIGKKVDLKVMGTGSHRVRGVLEAIEGDELVVQTPAPDADTEAVSVRVKLHRVLEGNLDPDFDAKAIINSDRRERKDSKRQARQEKAGRKKKGRPKNRSKDGTEKDGGSTT